MKPALSLFAVLLVVLVELGCSSQNPSSLSIEPDAEPSKMLVGTWISSTDPAAEGSLTATFKESGELQLTIPNSFMMSLIREAGIPATPVDQETGETVSKENMSEYLNKTFRKSASWRMDDKTETLFYEMQLKKVEKYESSIELTTQKLKFNLMGKEILLFRQAEN